MKKAWIGWTVAIVFIVAFVFLWAYNSNLKTKYTTEIQNNYFDFRSSEKHNIQMYEIILALQKSNLSDTEEIIDMRNITKDIVVNGGVSIPATSENEYFKYNEITTNLRTSLEKSLENPSPEEIQQFEQDLNLFKEYFSAWEDKVDACIHEAEFCVDTNTK